MYSERIIEVVRAMVYYRTEVDALLDGLDGRERKTAMICLRTGLLRITGLKVTEKEAGAAAYLYPEMIETVY